MTLSRRAAFGVAGAALAAGALACTTPAVPPGGRALQASGTYVQPPTGASFPERIGALARSDATAWDAAETNIGVSYMEGTEARITLYVYPAGEVRSGRLRAAYLGTEDALAQLHPAALRERGAIVRVPGPDGRAVGFESRFRLLDSAAARATLAQVFQCGRWFLKVRATYAEAYPIDPALDAVHEQVRCRDLALHDPIGTKRGVDFDPDGGAEWLVYGLTQLRWIDEHVAPEDLVYGIPDHDPDLFVEAWEAMLETRQEIQAKGGAEANPFLDRMLEVRDAGFLEAYVWSVQLGFLPAPEALASRIADFERWRESNLPAHRHEIHAAAHLRDGD